MSDKDTDILGDILGDDDDFFSSDTPTKSKEQEEPQVMDAPDAPETPETPDAPETPIVSSVGCKFPRVVGDVPSDFQAIVDRIQTQYKVLPKLDYEQLYEELAELAVKSCPTPTLQILNMELEKVQSAKDRLSEIMIDVSKSYIYKKRGVDMLKDIWQRFSDEKSMDKRQGDGLYRLAEFELDLAEVEGLNKACDHVARNLTSLQDNLSRRITVIQLQLKLRDIGRGALPDFDFNRIETDGFSEEEKNVEVDPSKGIEPVENDW